MRIVVLLVLVTSGCAEDEPKTCTVSCGQGDDDDDEVVEEAELVSLDCGTSHCCSLDVDGVVDCWLTEESSFGDTHGLVSGVPDGEGFKRFLRPHTRGTGPTLQARLLEQVVQEVR